MFQEQLGGLTIDGTLQIVGKKSPFQGQNFVMQVLSITNNYLGHYYSQISDGYCKVKCQLGPEVKELAQTQKLKAHSLISFSTSDFQMIDDSPSNPVLLVNHCQVLKLQFSKTIGSPMPYNLFKENNYQNSYGSNKVEEGPKIYTVKEILSNQRMKNSSIRAKVTKLPKNTSLGMFVFTLMDMNGDQIQGVCFEDVADNFYRQLRQGEQYIFSNFLIQKNKKTNQEELKFKTLDSFKSVEGKKTSQKNSLQGKSKGNFTIKAQQQQNQMNNGNIENKQKQNEQQSQKTYTKRQLLQIVRSNQTKDRFFQVVGKVTYLNQKPKFRKINVEDINKEVIDVLLWDQIKQPVLIGKFYKFSSLRFNLKNINNQQIKYIELNSSKKTMISTVQQSEFQELIRSRNNTPRKPYYHYSKFHQQPDRPERTKKLPQKTDLVPLSQILKLSQNQNNDDSPSYPYSECYIKIRTDALRFRDDGDALNFFSFYCKPCGKNISPNLAQNDIVFCSRCKQKDIQIKWNLRVRVMDLHNQIPCSIQNQATQKFINVKPLDGYLMYMKNKTDFQVLLHKVNFQNRVCKFQIKASGLNKYFNILEIYAKDTQITLQNKKQSLLKQLKQFDGK